MGVLGSILGLGRSPGEEKGYPLQYSGLENSMDCIVHGVTNSQTRLSDFHFHLRIEYFCLCFLSSNFGRLTMVEKRNSKEKSWQSDIVTFYDKYVKDSAGE